MHPVLVYALLFISTTIGLLFLFEKYPLGSIYLLLLISSLITALIGRTIIKLFPLEDPMQEEIDNHNRKLRSKQYKREIQYLFNIVQPDPKFQPSIKRIGESLEDCFDLHEDELTTRLKKYFGDDFNVKTNIALPDMVEAIKRSYHNWP